MLLKFSALHGVTGNQGKVQLNQYARLPKHGELLNANETGSIRTSARTSCAPSLSTLPLNKAKSLGNLVFLDSYVVATFDLYK